MRYATLPTFPLLLIKVPPLRLVQLDFGARKSRHPVHYRLLLPDGILRAQHPIVPSVTLNGLPLFATSCLLELDEADHMRRLLQAHGAMSPTG